MGLFNNRLCSLCNSRTATIFIGLLYLMSGVLIFVKVMIIKIIAQDATALETTYRLAHALLVIYPLCLQATFGTMTIIGALKEKSHLIINFVITQGLVLLLFSESIMELAIRRGKGHHHGAWLNIFELMIFLVFVLCFIPPLQYYRRLPKRTISNTG